MKVTRNIQHMLLKAVLMGVALSVFYMPTPSSSAVIHIIDTTFTSTGSPQPLDNTQIGLTENLPGGSWIWGGGWHWGSPRINATWQEPINMVNMVEEKTALGLSIQSTVGYSKPSILYLAADLRLHHTAARGALGFWSAMPARDNAVHGQLNFTGLYLDANNNTLQVYSGNALQGTPVNLGTVDTFVVYNLTYGIDTTTGSIFDVQFNGSSVSGLSSTAFTDANTAYAGFLTGTASRMQVQNFDVYTIIPEPSSTALFCFGLLLLRWARRTGRLGWI